MGQESATIGVLRWLDGEVFGDGKIGSLYLKERISVSTLIVKVKLFRIFFNSFERTTLLRSISKELYNSIACLLGHNYD